MLYVSEPKNGNAKKKNIYDRYNKFIAAKNINKTFPTNVPTNAHTHAHTSKYKQSQKLNKKNIHQYLALHQTNRFLKSIVIHAETVHTLFLNTLCVLCCVIFVCVVYFFFVWGDIAEKKKVKQYTNCHKSTQKKTNRLIFVEY